ncbi:MAG: NADH-quinone oxidoreductase subunit M, partial [Ferruginibacter sp.]|nr:NADH-quinone oxidoreductase subunit M [Ferruginibacter sp.]
MDQNISVTFPHALIFFPLLAGLITFLFKKDAAVKSWALLSSIITLCISLASMLYVSNKALSGLAFNYEWLKYIGASFSVSFDGMGRVLTLLTAISFPIIFVATYTNKYKNAN